MRERDRLGALKKTAALEVDREDDADGVGLALAAQGVLELKLLRAGISLSPKMFLLVAIVVSTWAALIGLIIGKLLALTCFIVTFQYIMSEYLDARAAKRKRKVIPQVPPFIDSLASGLGTGLNIEGSLAQAALGVPPGIFRSELDRVVNGMNRGFTMHEAMQIMCQRISGREIVALVVAVNIFSSVGGHLLEPFRRLARQIREQQAVIEKANRDLVIVKQAFYILFGLSFLAPAALMVLAPSYMAGAMNDSFGRGVLQAGMIMMIIAFSLFKRITNLKL